MDTFKGRVKGVKDLHIWEDVPNITNHREGANCVEGAEYDDRFDIHIWYPLIFTTFWLQDETQVIIFGLLLMASMKLVLLL